MTPDQLRLLAELDDWQIVAIADAPDYWCDYIKNTHGCGSVAGDWPAGYWRKTYPWGIAMTAPGDHMDTRSVTAPEHAVTLTWRQITAWAEALPQERRIAARRARMSIHTADETTAVAQLLAPVVTEPDLEPTLF